MLALRLRQGTIRNVGGYALAVLLSAGVVAGLLRLWEVDVSAPLLYSGDALYTAMQVRTVLEHGWYLENPRLGAPFGCRMYDFPLAEGLHFLLLKLLGRAGCDAVTAVNVYYLLSFPLTAGCSYFVFRRFGRGRLASLAGSLLFTFLPYHFHRGTCHLFLACYYLVPLVVLVVFWVYRGRGLSRGQVVAGAVICVLVGSAGVYYAFFGCFFLAVAGLSAAASSRRVRPLGAAALLVGVVVTAGLVNVAPNVLFGLRHGKNRLMRRGDYTAAEKYGLRITQLLLPVPGHRLTPLARLRLRYEASQERGEPAMAALGLLGSAGLLLLLARLLARRPLTCAPEVEEGLALLTAAGLLLATTAGFGCLLALLVSPVIRAYNRISVYLAFFALLALLLLLETLAQRYQHSPRARRLFRLLPVLLVLLGLFDQTADWFLPPQAPAAAAYRSDAEFVRAIEERLPPGAMVFQLPHLPFPEAVPPGEMADYDHFRAYLSSRSLRWSYGAMKGREEGSWQAAVSALPPAELLPALAFAGFRGLYVDRAGYPDGAGALAAELSGLLGAAPLRSADGRLLFFDLSDYAERLRRHYTPGEWESRRDWVLRVGGAAPGGTHAVRAD